MSYKVAIIGGGASGFFAANCLLENQENNIDITMFEASSKLLSKVRISGGGRCNVCHNEEKPTLLAKQYPRGGKKLVELFKLFGTNETIAWLKKRGVTLKIEEDGRMFPTTNTSETIVNCLQSVKNDKRFQLKLQSPIKKIEQKTDGFYLNDSEESFQSVIVATGGKINIAHFAILEEINLDIEAPVPSLFTFNINDSKLQALSGVSVPNAQIKIEGDKKLVNQGPMLVTHWGLSGPCVLRLSAFGAKFLNEKEYVFSIQVNWLGNTEAETREALISGLSENSKKKIENIKLEGIPNRLWVYFLEKASIPLGKISAELSKKDQNKLVEFLYNSSYKVEGKSTFKEEFVTAGGVKLDELDLLTMQNKAVKGLYVTGEAVNVDGVTGGFNFQFAWTSAYLASQKIIETAALN